MPTTCAFELDRLNPIYSSGEYVNGKIILKTDKIKRVNSVYVTLEGEAKVQWSISGKETASYCGRQQYLYSRANVFDNSDFAAGTHVYVLTLRIPPDCPSSVKGPYGYIAYNISVVIDKQRSFDEVFRKPICVIQTLDLNFHPEYALPIKEETLKYLCQWLCTSGPLRFNLMLPYAGFVPGQHIKYFLELDNQSPHYDILGVEASLKQHYVFLARKPVKRNFYTKSLAKSSIEERTLRLTKRLYEGNVYVPTDTPRSTLNLNYIVFIHYTLQVKLKTGAFHYDTDISAPVVIGTVPLRQFQEEQREMQRNYNRDCNLCSGSTVGGSLVTTQPRLRLRQELDRLMGSSQDMEEEELNRAIEKMKDDEPPSYDSCLPPSFSFATTFGSFKQQELEVAELKSQENRRINIQLPQFPGYNTFNSHTQAPSQSNDSLLEEDNIYNSYGSIYTDHTGRSLDTLDILSCSGAVGEECRAQNEEEVLGEQCKEEDVKNEVEAKVLAAVRESSTQAELNMDSDNNHEDDNSLELLESVVNSERQDNEDN
ncbi:arrestin domain-containing protein 3 [Cochliomyia hominivorax]